MLHGAVENIVARCLVVFFAVIFGYDLNAIAFMMQAKIYIAIVPLAIFGSLILRFAWSTIKLIARSSDEK